jgi:hypothetical protein
MSERRVRSSDGKLSDKRWPDVVSTITAAHEVARGGFLIYRCDALTEAGKLALSPL